MAGDRDDPQRRNQQRHHGEQRDFKEQRQRHRHADADQALQRRPVRAAEIARLAFDVALRRCALHVPAHHQEHKPVDAAGGDAAADAAQLRHTELAVDKDVVDRDIHQQAEEADHHAGLGFGQPFALVAHHLEEQVTRRPPHDGVQITDGFIRQLRIDVVHHVDDELAVIQHHDQQHGHAGGQPKTLAHLVSDAIAPPGAVELGDNRSQRQQQAVAEQDGRQPD